MTRKASYKADDPARATDKWDKWQAADLLDEIAVLVRKAHQGFASLHRLAEPDLQCRIDAIKVFDTELDTYANACSSFATQLAKEAEQEDIAREAAADGRT